MFYLKAGKNERTFKIDWKLTCKNQSSMKIITLKLHANDTYSATEVVRQFH